MLIVRGVNLYPSQIEHVLLGVEGVSPALPARRRAPGRSSTRSPCICEGEGDDLAERVRRAIREQIGVGVRVEVAARSRAARARPSA